MQPKISKAGNGLDVITINMPHVKSVVINLLVRVGSRYETPALHGITHFLEHMAFKGTSKRSYRQIAEEFDHIGGSFNAYTSKEYTVYEIKVLNKDIVKAIDILSDIIEDSVFLPEEIEKERKVIFQEIAQTYDDPNDYVYDQLFDIAFKDQALGRSILGEESNLSRFTNKEFNNYIKDHYTTDNMVIAASGDVDHNQFLKIIDSYFLKLSKNNLKINHEKPIFTNGFKIDSRPHLEQTQFVLAYSAVGYRDLEEFYLVQMLSLILGGGISSRLFQEIRENKALCYSVSSFIHAYTDAGLFCIYAATNHDKLEELSFSLIGEVKKICENISQNEIERAKAQINANVLMCQEKPSYQCDTAIKDYAMMGRIIDYKDTLEFINQIKASDLLKTAEQIFKTRPALSLVGDKFTEENYNKIFFN